MGGHRKTWLGLFGIAGLVCMASASQAAPWDKLLSGKRVEADPNKTYSVTETNGPWMIMTCSFSGPQAEEQAKQLVLEFRSRYKLPAYQFEKKFDLGKEVGGLGFDRYGNPKRMKYAKGKSEIEEIAVLVGDYPSADDPEAQATLKKVKLCQPESLKYSEEKPTAQSLAGLRALQSAVLPDGNERKNRGPMSHAMITTNPLLPSEFFAPQGLDEVVLKANEGVQYCLLDCPGKYTVMVAHFVGKHKIVLHDKDLKEGLAKMSNPEESWLIKAAENAHNLTEALRLKGYEAYEFHDRNASIVTVGSFESVGTPRADGVIELNAPIKQIMQKFEAKKDKAGRTVPEQVIGIALDPQPIIVHAPKRPITSALRREKSTRQ